MLLGALGMVLLVVGLFVSGATQFFHSYLLGYILFLGLCAGSLGLLMLQYLTGGAWGVIARRIFEAGSRLMPIAAILFIPIIPSILSEDPHASDRASWHRVRREGPALGLMLAPIGHRGDGRRLPRL